TAATCWSAPALATPQSWSAGRTRRSGCERQQPASPSGKDFVPGSAGRVLSRPMIIGREALVEEFVVHRLGAERTDSVYSDFTVTLKSDVEQEFLRKLFLKPFAQMATTSEFTHPVALEYNVLNGLCEGLRNGQDLLEGSLAIARHLLDV